MDLTSTRKKSKGNGREKGKGSGSRRRFCLCFVLVSLLYFRSSKESLQVVLSHDLLVSLTHRYSLLSTHKIIFAVISHK